MTALNKQALRQTAEKAQEHGVFNMDIHSETVLALLDELEAKDKQIVELSASHGKLHEGMAAIYNAICENGASTSLSAILTFVKRAFEESKVTTGISVKGE